jgi:hypothetical protein
VSFAVCGKHKRLDCNVALEALYIHEEGGGNKV